MLTDIKLSKAQLFKVNQSSGFFSKTLGNMMSNLGKKALIDGDVALAADVLPKLATKSTSSAIEKAGKK